MKYQHLQGIGDCPAIEAAKLETGMTLVWNYGWQSDVMAITPSKTGKTLTVTIRCHEDGKTYQRKLRATSLVVVRGLHD